MQKEKNSKFLKIIKGRINYEKRNCKLFIK